MWRGKHTDYVFSLLARGTAAIDNGTLIKEFTNCRLSSSTFDWEAGHYFPSIAFAIFGKDMLACNVAADEEGYLSLWRPKELNRQNARAGDAIVIHFAYLRRLRVHGQVRDAQRLCETGPAAWLPHLRACLPNRLPP